MKKEDVKVGGRYLMINGKNEVEVTVVRAGEKGFIIKTKSGKNMPVNNADRFLECLEAPAEKKAEKKLEAAPVAKKETAPVKAPAKVSKAVKFLPEKKEAKTALPERTKKIPYEKSENDSEIKNPEAPVEKKVPATKVKKEKSDKKMSMTNAAIDAMKNLKPNAAGFTVQEIFAEMEASGLWERRGGKTPINTLAARITVDILHHEEPRFAKVSRGHYKLA